jgi:hypothetical protein
MEKQDKFGQEATVFDIFLVAQSVPDPSGVCPDLS